VEFTAYGAARPGLCGFTASSAVIPHKLEGSVPAGCGAGVGADLSLAEPDDAKEGGRDGPGEVHLDCGRVDHGRLSIGPMPPSPGIPAASVSAMSEADAMPPPYDVHNFLNLLGIEIDERDSDVLAGRFTVTRPLIAGTGYLWAPVVITLADALCAFGVSRHWPEGAASFTTVESKANFTSSAREGELVTGEATPLHLGGTTQVWDATVTNQTTGRLMAAYRCTQLILYPRPE
jgi:1,4-dihydroxy-2-naphthoyl-CoA hydrolase